MTADHVFRYAILPLVCLVAGTRLWIETWRFFRDTREDLDRWSSF